MALDPRHAKSPYKPDRKSPYETYQAKFLLDQMALQQQSLNAIGRSEADVQHARPLSNGDAAGDAATEHVLPSRPLRKKGSNFSFFGRKNGSDADDGRANARPEGGLRRLKSAFLLGEKRAGEFRRNQQQQSQDDVADDAAAQQRSRRRGASFHRIIRPVKSLTDLSKRVSGYFSLGRDDDDFNEDEGASFSAGPPYQGSVAGGEDGDSDVSDAESDETVRAVGPVGRDEQRRSESIYSREVEEERSVGSSARARRYDEADEERGEVFDPPRGRSRFNREDEQNHWEVVNQMEWAERQKRHESYVLTPSPAPHQPRLQRRPRMIFRSKEDLRKSPSDKTQEEPQQRPRSDRPNGVVNPHQGTAKSAEEWSMYSADVTATASAEWQDEESQARVAHLTTIETPGGSSDDALAALEGESLPSGQKVRKSKSVAFDIVERQTMDEDDDYDTPVVNKTSRKSLAAIFGRQKDKVTKPIPGSSERRQSDDTQGTISPRTPVRSSMRPVSMFEPNLTAGTAMPHDAAYAGPSKTLERTNTMRKAVSAHQLSEKAAGKRPIRPDATDGAGMPSSASEIALSADQLFGKVTARPSSAMTAADGGKAPTPTSTESVGQAIGSLKTELHLLEHLRSNLRARRRRIETSHIFSIAFTDEPDAVLEDADTALAIAEAEKVLKAAKRKSAAFRLEPDDSSQHEGREKVEGWYAQEERKLYEALRASVDEVRREVETERTSLDITRRRFGGQRRA